MESKLDQEILALKQDIIQGVLQNIAIKSVKGLSGTDAPFGIGPKEALLDAMEQSKKLGLKTVNLDNKIGYSEIGEGEEMVAILGHLDVVPFGDGWTKNPYGEILDDKIYGRGAADNKGPTIASLYALKAIQDLQIPLDKRIRVIYGSDEESGFQCVKHYIESGEELPVMGFTPDADYPVIFAEKGMIGLSLSKKIEATEDFRLLELEGGVAKNVVMPFVKMKYQSSSHILEGSNKVKNNVYEINFNGKSAHASTPELGSNAFMKLCKAVSTISMDNDFMDIIHFVNDQFNFETNGKTLGVHYKDEESGEITLNIGLVSLLDQELTFTVDVRYPVTMDAQPFLATMENITKKYGIKMATTTHEKPLYIPKDSLLIQTLMKVYQEKTGDYTEAKSIGGGTYAKAFQNMVAFGVEFPGDTLPIHQPDEYIEIDKLIKSTQISAEAIVQLAKTGPSL